jgi:hypothetical protein
MQLDTSSLVSACSHDVQSVEEVVDLEISTLMA